MWDPGVLSGVRVEEWGLSNDQSTLFLLPWHLLVPTPTDLAVWSQHKLHPIRTSEPTTIGSRSNSDVLQNVTVFCFFQPVLKVLPRRSFVARIRRGEKGESQRKKKKIEHHSAAWGGCSWEGKEAGKLQEATLKPLALKMLSGYKSKATLMIGQSNAGPLESTSSACLLFGFLC